MHRRVTPLLRRPSIHCPNDRAALHGRPKLHRWSFRVSGSQAGCSRSQTGIEPRRSQRSWLSTRRRCSVRRRRPAPSKSPRPSANVTCQASRRRKLKANQGMSCVGPSHSRHQLLDDLIVRTRLVGPPNWSIRQQRKQLPHPSGIVSTASRCLAARSRSPKLAASNSIQLPIAGMILIGTCSASMTSRADQSAGCRGVKTTRSLQATISSIQGPGLPVMGSSTIAHDD
jgi:hypothetical protein